MQQNFFLKAKKKKKKIKTRQMIELWRLTDVSKAAHRYILLKNVMTNVQKMSQCRQTGWQFAHIVTKKDKL